MNDSETQSPVRPSTPAREFLGGLVGVGIALVCVLPPLLHLLTGPLGPFIGGFVVSRQLIPEQRGRVIIAGTMAFGMAGLAALVAFAIAHFSDPKSLPSWFPAPDLIGLIVAGIGTYAGMLSFAGTLASAALAKRDTQPG